MLEKPHLLIANNTDDVIAWIKKQNCLLNETIEPYPEISSLEKFVTYHYWSNSESVNVFQVKGTTCSDYVGVTWIDMLRSGKKMPHNFLFLVENPDYYFQKTKKEPVMHYTKINDKIFISGEGNHRTAIAKVLFYCTGDAILHGVEYNEYQIDFKLKELYEKTKSLLFRKFPHIEIIPENRILKREDTSGWKKDYYKNYFKLINHRKNKQIEISGDELETIYMDFSSFNILKSLFSKSIIKKIL